MVRRIGDLTSPAVDAFSHHCRWDLNRAINIAKQLLAIKIGDKLCSPEKIIISIQLDIDEMIEGRSRLDGISNGCVGGGRRGGRIIERHCFGSVGFDTMKNFIYLTHECLLGFESIYRKRGLQ